MHVGHHKMVHGAELHLMQMVQLATLLHDIYVKDRDMVFTDLTVVRHVMLPMQLNKSQTQSMHQHPKVVAVFPNQPRQVTDLVGTLLLLQVVTPL